jgi:hypothetical protein
LSILSTVTPAVKLLAPSTPQGAAFEWIVDSDPAKMDPCGKARDVIQRYALATLYYSTLGGGWTVSTLWLSESSECSWAGVACADSADDDDKNNRTMAAVVSLDLGEYRVPSSVGEGVSNAKRGCAHSGGQDQSRASC